MPHSGNGRQSGESSHSTSHHQRSLVWAAPSRQALNLPSKKFVPDRLRASFMAFSKCFAASASQPAITWPGEKPAAMTATLAGWIDGDSAKGRMKVEGRA